MIDVAVIDYETMPIRPRPQYPPWPVGVSIRMPGEPRSHYYAWGHPTGNNCRVEDVLPILDEIHRSGVPTLYQNAKFDVAVSVEKLGLPDLPWHRIHDTMFLLFLNDPHSNSLSLKPAAEQMLDWPPEEQDAVFEWVMAHKKELEAETGIKVAKSTAGAFIGYAPGDLVAPYAEGDTDRTLALFDHLYDKVHREGMGPAYDRKRRCLPIFMANERDGIRVDVDALERDIHEYTLEKAQVERGLRTALGAPDLNIDADADLAEALSRAGIVDDDKWVKTKTGQRSVSKDNLTPTMFNVPEIAYALGYRNRLQTVMNNFMVPWLEQGKARDGVVSTNWNQVRDPSGGTRTGRPSTSRPNFLNIAKAFEGRSDGYQHPDFIPSAARPGETLRPLPLVRQYMLPDEGCTWVRRDFANQEVRILAHYEMGDLRRAYLENPDLDPHGWVRDEIKSITGNDMDRGKVKSLNFLAIYGGGVPAAARNLGVGHAQARQYKAFHDKALPGRRVINEEILRLVRRGEPVWTWGGRRYYVRPPSKGQSYEYQLINYLCQGSAADLTEEALIEWHEHPDRDARFLVTVYDEINACAPTEDVERQMRLMRECMNRDRLCVPMRSDGEAGSTWGNLEDHEP